MVFPKSACKKTNSCEDPRHRVDPRRADFDKEFKTTEYAEHTEKQPLSVSSVFSVV
jgi:hypothetical protein